MRFMIAAAAAAYTLTLVEMPTDVMAKAPMVGGATMSASKTIIQNAMSAKNLTTFVAAVKAAGLVDTLEGPGPFTVLTPTNDAFAKLPAGTVDNLLKPENRAQLLAILTYHVVPGFLSNGDLEAKIKEGGGKGLLKTVQGGTLTAQRTGKAIVIMDTKGDVAHVPTQGIKQSNGVIYPIDTLMLP